MTSGVRVSVLLLFMVKMASSEGTACFGRESPTEPWKVGTCKSGCDAGSDVQVAIPAGETDPCDSGQACCVDTSALPVCRISGVYGDYFLGECAASCPAGTADDTAQSGFECMPATDFCCRKDKSGVPCGETDSNDDVKIGQCSPVEAYCAPGETGTTNHGSEFGCSATSTCCIPDDAEPGCTYVDGGNLYVGKCVFAPLCSTPQTLVAVYECANGKVCCSEEADPKPGCVYDDGGTYFGGKCVNALLCSTAQTAETDHDCTNGNVCCAEGDALDAGDVCFPARRRS